MLPPKHFNCSTIAPNETNTTVSPNETTTTVARTVSQKSTTVRTIVGNLSNTSSSEKVKKDGRIKPVDPIYNYSREYGRTVLTDVS